MQMLIISDIHGNLPALEYVLESERQVDIVVSLGDVVNYGPWSNECVDLLDSLKNKVLLKGNHEDAFLLGSYPGTNEIANTFFEFCYPSFTRKNEITKYVEEYNYDGFSFAHTLDNKYIYVDTEIAFDKNVFIGHSHRQFIKTNDEFSLVNVGSVGQNRLNIDELNYVIWETETGKINLIKKEFRADGLLNEMKSRNYPELCVNYIRSKRIL